MGNNQGKSGSTALRFPTISELKLLLTIKRNNKTAESVNAHLANAKTALQEKNPEKLVLALQGLKGASLNDAQAGQLLNVVNEAIEKKMLTVSDEQREKLAKLPQPENRQQAIEALEEAVQRKITETMGYGNVTASALYLGARAADRRATGQTIAKIEEMTQEVLTQAFKGKTGQFIEALLEASGVKLPANVTLSGNMGTGNFAALSTLHPEATASVNQPAQQSTPNFRSPPGSNG